MNADASGLHLLAQAQFDRVTDLDWSPDGQEIAYTFNYVCCLEHVVISKVGGPGFRALIGAKNAVDTQTLDISPAWSPDGARIAFSGQPWLENGGVGSAGVWVANSSGPPNLVQLFQGPGGRPSWSPDRNRIAFERNGSVWTMKSDGSDQVNLATGGQPSWGPRN